MSIENRRQLENTRAKLREMQQLLLRSVEGPAESEHVRELTLRSVKKRINQFTEEITRFESRVSPGILAGMQEEKPGLASANS